MKQRTLIKKFHAHTPLAHTQASTYREGEGGALYTWGGVNELVTFGDSKERRDSNKGCLGHGEGDLYGGTLTPARWVARVR
jgi:hypothetical protein